MAAEPVHVEEARHNQSTKDPSTVTYVVILAFLLLIGWGIDSLRKYFHTPPPVVSLSAYFGPSQNDPKAHLKIKGQVYRDGKVFSGGAVQLAVDKQDESFHQNVTVPLNDKGEFETEDPAFSLLHSNDQIHITAEVLISKNSERTTQDLYLNARPPSLTPLGEGILWGAALVLVGVFCWAFTGRKTPGKNRIAIILSYCIIGLSLAIPLLAPVLWLRAFPNARCEMNGAPVGLVIAAISNEQDNQPQWALNIGGHAFKMASAGAPEKTSENTTAADGLPKDAGALDKPISAQTQQNPSDSAPRNLPTQSTDKENNAEKNQDQAKPNGDAAATEKAGCEDIVTVRGGLVIPFYVIILSVIGGAINMTRKVPQLQKEGEYSQVPTKYTKQAATFVETKLSAVVSAVKVSGGKKSSSPPRDTSLEQQADSKNEGQATTAVPEPAPGLIGTATQSVEDEQAGTTPRTPASQSSTKAPGTEEKAATKTAGTKGENENQTKEDAAGALAEPVADKAREIDTKLAQLVKDQVQRNDVTHNTIDQILDLVQQMQNVFDLKKDERVLGFESFEDWLGNRVDLKALLGSNWRVALLNQYMYLVSAPFLAIVSYYMLQQLQLVSKQAIVVLVSFSVGLVSEKIVSSILGMATGYLHTDKSSTVAN
jgi:hypothetical protein